MRGIKMDDRHNFKATYKPKNYNELSYILWGAIIVDWEWAINTQVWKQYEESKIL